MAITVNGMIAKENGDTSFVSRKEWVDFLKMTRKVGNLIIGSRTYKIMERNKDFRNLSGVEVVAVSKSKNFKVGHVGYCAANSPKSALGVLKRRGFKSVLVGGGGRLNASFMAENLVDEICLDVEPVVLGRGVGVFVGKNFESKLKLLGTKKISPNEIQLRYKVIR